MAILYRHLKPNNEVFYIGIGTTKERAYSKYNRNKYWRQIVKKYNYKVEIIFDNLTWDEACKLEISLIWLYGRKDLKKGTLCNLTNGGEGNFGMIHSVETKLKMSNSAKNVKWSKERKLNNKKFHELNKVSDITRDKMSNAKKGKKWSESHRLNRLNSTKVISKQTRLNMSLNNARANSMKIIDSSNNKIYTSIRDAYNILNFSFSYGYLTSMLRGNKLNKTTLKYYKDGV